MKYVHIGLNAAQMSDVLHVHCLSCWHCLWLTLFKMHIRTAPTANTAYLEVYMHVHVHKYIKYCFVVETHEILEGIRSNYYTLLCSKKMSTKEANYFWSPCLKSSWTDHCLHAFSSALGYFSHKIFHFCSCIWQL